MHSRSTLIQQALSKLSSFSQEIFGGIAVIKSHNIQNRIAKRFKGLSSESFEKNIFFCKNTSVVFSANGFFNRNK